MRKVNVLKIDGENLEINYRNGLSKIDKRNFSLSIRTN